MPVSSFSTPRIFRFGVYEVDASTGELRKRGVRLKLPERSFRILTFLLEQQGQPVTREQLRQQLWQDDTFVDFDHGLNNAVMQLRAILCDSAATPRYIETLHRRGYRFVAPVEEVPVLAPARDAVEIKLIEAVDTPLTASALPAAAKRKRPRSLLYVVPVLLALAGSFAIPGVRSGAVRLFKTGKDHRSLVVLPLENLSGDKNQDYFADGMTDELIATLAKIGSLRVVSHSTAMSYKGTHRSLSEIAHELNVDAVIEGTVMRVGDQVRITAELVQVSTDHHLWAETYQSSMGDILGLQNRVSSAIVNEIRINLTPQEKQRLQQKPHVRPEAYESYLKGRYFWNRRSTGTLGNAIQYFEKATSEDPQYTLAYAALADCYGIASAPIFGTMAPNESGPKAKDAANRALALDPASAEAETSLATVKFNYDWDWAGADAGFRAAISLAPNYGTAHQRYSLFLMAMGRFQNSLEQMNQARELDPLSLSTNFSLGWRLYMARQYAAAILQLHNTLDMDPGYELPHVVLGQAYEQTGDWTAAISELKRAAELAHYSPLTMAALAHAYALSGNRVGAQQLLTTLLSEAAKQYVSPYYIAIVFAGLQDRQSAMKWLEKSYAERENGLVFLRVEPELDDLRSDARFIKLEEKLKLPR